MDRRYDPKSNVPTVATLATAFVVALTNWATAAVPDTVPVEVVAAGHGLVVAAVAVAVGKVSQRFTWAEDTVNTIMDAEAVIGAAERGEHDGGAA